MALHYPRWYTDGELVELVIHEGSGIEFSDDSDSADTNADSGEEFVPAGDNFSADSDSDNREVTAAADDDPVPMDKPVADVRPTAATLPFPLYNDMDIDEALWMFKWSKDLNNFPLAAPFTGDSALKLPINFPATPTPADFYQPCVDQSVIKQFKTVTNRYAASVCNQKEG